MELLLSATSFTLTVLSKNRKSVLTDHEMREILVLFHFSHCKDLRFFYLHENTPRR